MSKLSSKHQVTIPVRILREAGLTAGDEVVIRTHGHGRIEIERAGDLVMDAPLLRRQRHVRHVGAEFPQRVPHLLPVATAYGGQVKLGRDPGRGPAAPRPPGPG